MKQDNQDKKSIYRLGKLTLLEIMAVLTVIGVLANWLLHQFF